MKEEARVRIAPTEQRESPNTSVRTALLRMALSIKVCKFFKRVINSRLCRDMKWSEAKRNIPA